MQRGRWGAENAYESLAIAGGSSLRLAKQLGCENDVQRLIFEGQHRLKAYRTCAGMEGGA